MSQQLTPNLSGTLAGTAIAVALAAVAGFSSSCGDDRASSGSGRERVNQVAARPDDRADPGEMCDVYFARPEAAPKLVFPRLVAESPAAAPGWRWINVWATWCKPCVAELPHLPRWRDRLVKGGTPVTLELVSADESDAVVTEFRARHPSTPPGPRLADAEELAEWARALGVAGATLPIHIFVDPTGRVRCVRASEMAESDLAAVAGLIGRE